jgi:hypothetical protein
MSRIGNDQATSVVFIAEGKEANVSVSRLDGDRFVLSMQEAVDACGAFSKRKELGRQFDDLLSRIAQWLHPRVARIESAHLAIRDGRLVLVVMQRAEPFDRQLCEELVEFDLELANDPGLDLIKLDVLTIPHVPLDAASAFVAP